MENEKLEITLRFSSEIESNVLQWIIKDVRTYATKRYKGLISVKSELVRC